MNEVLNRKDVIIIGGGIAGITAAIHTSTMALETVVIERTPYLGQVQESSYMANYPGFRKITGSDLAHAIEIHATQDFSVDINREEVHDIIMDRTAHPYRFLIKTDHGHYLSKVVIYAAGSRAKELSLAGNDLHGVTYYPVYDEEELVDRDLAIVGVWDPSIIHALWLVTIARSITFIEHPDAPIISPMYRNELKKLLDKQSIPITIVEDHEIAGINGTGNVEALSLVHTQTRTTKDLPVDSVIINVGRVPNTDLITELGCEMDKDGFVVVNREQKTDIEGVFAIGDVTGVLFHAIKAAGEGSVAGVKAAEYLRKGIW